MKIALLGDIAFFGQYCLKNNNNLSSYFENVRNYLKKFDFVIGNLETPFVDKENPIFGKSATIKSDPCNIEILSSLGITHVTLANNHMGDHGVRAYELTKKLLSDHQIHWYGTEDKQVKIEYQGEKIALLGYCSYNTNPSHIKINKKNGLNHLKAKEVYSNMKKNSDLGFFNILAIHSGQEHVHSPSAEDVRFARLLAEKFDYIYYGHHPHVIQGYEKVNNSALFYSLGNFIFDDVYTSRDTHKPLIKLSEENKTGLICDIEIKNGTLIRADSMQVYMGKERMLLDQEIKFDHREIYNSYLSQAGSIDYDSVRNKQILKYFSSRKKMRDLDWYLNRLNLNSLGIIIKSKLNARKYREYFVSEINLLEENK